ESVNPTSPGDSSVWRLLNKANRTAWMGREPESCVVISIDQKEAVPIGRTATIDHAEFIVLVGYRPHGWISDVKDGETQRRIGGLIERRSEMPDGPLLDGTGKPLPPGAEPVYRSFRGHDVADFNVYDLGEFLGES